MFDTPDLFDSFEPSAEPTTIRGANRSDRKALERLADLDGGDDVGEAPHIVAEEDGEIVASLSLADGTAIGHPFRLTTHAVALLRLRAAQLTALEPRRATSRRARVALQPGPASA